MRLILLFVVLWPISVAAQNGEHALKFCSSMLASNRVKPVRFGFSTKREKKRLDTLSITAENLRSQALDFFWQHDYEQAAFTMEKTTRLFPKEHGLIGEYYLLLLDYPRALQHLNAFDALTSAFDDIIGNSPVSYIRGLTLRSMGDHTKALEQFSRGIDTLEAKHGVEWVNYRHYVSRAVSYIATNQPEKALSDLDKATKNFGRSALVQYHRGRALLLANRRSEAQAAFQDASFFIKALRMERAGNYQEDEDNPVFESEINDALTALKR